MQNRATAYVRSTGGSLEIGGKEGGQPSARGSCFAVAAVLNPGVVDPVGVVGCIGGQDGGCPVFSSWLKWYVVAVDELEGA